MNDGELVAGWREIFERYHVIWGALDHALRDRHQLGVSEYEVLERLTEETTACEKAACRMQELGACVRLSQSALSRVVSRLESDGLVLRTMCEDDRRGIWVEITEAGRRRYAESKLTHRAVLAEKLDPTTPALTPAARVPVD